MPRRWDDDRRGRGIADARRLVSGASELVAAFGEPEWVAERPELHLRPHVEAWCERDQRLALSQAHSDELGGYVLDLEWRGPRGSVGQVRAAVFSLIGEFAEGATYVRQRRLSSDDKGRGAELRFEVGTGELAPDSRFDSHGHLVVITVAGVF